MRSIRTACATTKQTMMPQNAKRFLKSQRSQIVVKSRKALIAAARPLAGSPKYRKRKNTGEEHSARSRAILRKAFVNVANDIEALREYMRPSAENPGDRG